MKKSLLITLDFPPKKGGVSHSLYNICKCFPDDKIIVIAPPNQSDTIKSPKIYRKNILSPIKFIWPKWIFSILLIKKVINKEKIDIIHAGQILPVGTIALILNKVFKIPYCVYIYGMDLVVMRHSIRKMKLIKLILKNAHTIIANSNWTKNRAIQLKADENKIVVVYPCANKLDTVKIAQSELDNFKTEYNLVGKKILLSVGNLVTRKGHDMVISAMSEVIKEVKDIIYIVIGSGPNKENLIKQVEQTGLVDNVKFFFNIPNTILPKFYNIANIFIMPARELKDQYNKTIDVEGFGMVFLEANLYGKPVIGGLSGGQSEAIQDNYSGLLVNPENIRDISQAILKLANNAELRHKLGIQGKNRVIKQFNLQSQVSKIIERLS